jgi:hypothetical protein
VLGNMAELVPKNDFSALFKNHIPVQEPSPLRSFDSVARIVTILDKLKSLYDDNNYSITDDNNYSITDVINNVNNMLRQYLTYRTPRNKTVADIYTTIRRICSGNTLDTTLTLCGCAVILTLIGKSLLHHTTLKYKYSNIANIINILENATDKAKCMHDVWQYSGNIIKLPRANKNMQKTREGLFADILNNTADDIPIAESTHSRVMSDTSSISNSRVDYTNINPDDMSDDNGDDNITPADIAHDMADDISDDISDDTADDTADDMSDDISGDDNIGNDTADIRCIKMINGYLNKIGKGCKYVRINCIAINKLYALLNDDNKQIVSNNIIRILLPQLYAAICNVTLMPPSIHGALVTGGTPSNIPNIDWLKWNPNYITAPHFMPPPNIAITPDILRNLLVNRIVTAVYMRTQAKDICKLIIEVVAAIEDHKCIADIPVATKYTSISAYNDNTHRLYVILLHLLPCIFDHTARKNIENIIIECKKMLDGFIKSRRNVAWPELQNTIDIINKMCDNDFTQFPESVEQAQVVFDIMGISLLEYSGSSNDAGIIKEYCLKYYKPTAGNIISISIYPELQDVAVKWLYAACILSICNRWRINMGGDIFKQASELLLNKHINLDDLARSILQKAV